MLARRLAFGLTGAMVIFATSARADPPGEAVSFSALPGFAEDDLGVAFRAFRGSCNALLGRGAAVRAAAPPPAALLRVCAGAPSKAGKTARRFFERHFVARRIAGDAFFTGYYEPVVEGSLVRTATFATPLYAPPSDLTSIKPGSVPGLDPTLTAARRLSDGRLVAMPDRAAIETGALGAAARPLVYVRSAADAFFIQVQGSARIRLSDRSLRRIMFAGRNGYPYTSIGKLLVARLHIPPSEMGMSQLRAWIEDHGQGSNDAGTALMRENRSYIFFGFDKKLPAKAGPIGGQGISLTPLRSAAIDRTAWPYGLPFYVETTLSNGRPFRRLVIGQDTGAAIIGTTRADIFFGTGEEAAREAGPMRQKGALYVLWPKDQAPSRSAPRAKPRTLPR